MNKFSDWIFIYGALIVSCIMGDQEFGALCFACKQVKLKCYELYSFVLS